MRTTSGLEKSANHESTREREEVAMRTARVLSMTIAVLLTAGVPATAHHSFSAVFDRERPIAVTGPITEVE